MQHKRKISPNVNTSIMNTENKIKVFSELVNRANLFAKMGTMTYNGNRDIYQALGYPETLNYSEHYLPKYIRHDIAKAIIDRPVRAAWRGGFTIQKKGSKGIESEVEKKWNELELKFKLHSIFMRIDKLTGIGRYGVLLLGLNDSNDLSLPVQSKSNKLLYIKPLSEGSALISSYETDVKNPRYGKPLTYSITLSNGQGDSTTTTVHYTRIIHIAEDLLENEYLGTPRLEPVFNRILDLEKIIGGDAEMFWRGARPGFQGNVDKDFTLTPESTSGLQDQFDEYENNLRRFLLMEGVKVEQFKQDLADPSKHVDVQVSMISAIKGIPKRILMGSERGELSSAQDREEWNLWVQSRREEFMEPDMVRPVVDRFMELGILPTTEYLVHWDELFAMSPSEKAEIAEKIANAIRYYTATPSAEYILPKELFLRKLLGLTKEELEEATRLVDILPEIEPMITPQEQTALDEQSPVGSPIKRQRRNPMAGTGTDTVAKKQKA